MRARFTRIPIYFGTHSIKGSPPSDKYLNQVLWNTELVEGDRGNWGYPDFPPDRDIGGPFFVRGHKRVMPKVSVGKIIRPGAPNEETYTGCVGPSLEILSMVSGKLADPSSWGATAYNRMRPDKPNFEGLNAIYELKDLPGMLEQRLRRISDIGNYYLALQFGWKPLYRDVVNLVKTQMSAQDRLKQLIRDNGRPVRRKIMLEDVRLPGGYTDSIGYPVSAMQPILPTQFYAGQHVTKLNLYDYRKTWASAQFRYWLPEGPRDILWTARMMARIFGFNPTPKVVYNAIPWSWLVDWFTNAGDVIANMSGGIADRLAADRFYLMQERGAYGTLEGMGVYYRYPDFAPVRVSGTASEQWYHKVRLKGDPFGLNTSQNNLSGMQLSILGALGLSRLR